MLSCRHSIGHRSPLEPLARESKSVPHFRCYASLPEQKSAPFRLPRTKYPKIQREGIDKTVKEECTHIPRGYPQSHKRTQTGADRGVDRHAQPQDSWMGTVPPAHRIKRNL